MLTHFPCLLKKAEIQSPTKHYVLQHIDIEQKKSQWCENMETVNSDQQLCLIRWDKIRSQRL